MAIMDFFKPAVQQPQQQQQQPQPNGQPQNNGVQGPGATPPNNGNTGNTPNSGQQPPVNPLDAYSKMWDNPSDGKTEVAPAFQIDSKTMDSVVSQQDFMRGVDPAIMQKATSGDAQAMMEIMQTVARNSYRSSMEHSSMLTDRFVTAREGFNEKSFGNKVRGELTTQALANTPNFSHPVVRKQLTDVAQRLQQQHPDAAPQEIAKMAKDYVTELAAALNPKEESNDGQRSGKGKPATDWDNFFDESQG